MMKRTLALFMVVCLLFSCVMVSGMIVTAEDAASAASGVLEQERLDTATEVLARLVVLQGYEDGTYGEANNITRAEYAALLSRALRGGNAEPVGAPAVSEFTDVPTDHWACGDIHFLYQSGIVAGFGDGTFNPEANVTTEQVAKMMVCALGYGFMAEGAGYPNGYIKTASDIKLLRGIQLGIGTPASRGLTFVMLYNALTLRYLTPESVKGDNLVYDGDGSLLTDVFELEKVNGMVQANEITGIKSAKLAVEEGQVMIDNVVYESLDPKAADYLGYTVNAYVKVNEDDASRGVLYVVEPVTKATSVTIASNDIIDIDDNGSVITVKAYDGDKKKEYTVKSNANVLLNDVAYTGILDEDDLNPEFGSITLVSTDGGKNYDLVKIENYTPMYVEQVKSSSKQIVGVAVENGAWTNKTYSLNNEDNTDLIVLITSEGEAVDFDAISKDSVVYVRVNGDFIGVEIASGAVEDGAIDKLSSSAVFINGKEYDSVAGALAGFALGDNVIAYKTKEDVVFYAEKGAKVTNAQYGFLLDAGSDGPNLLQDQTITFKVVMQDGSVKFLESAEKMKFNDVRIGNPGATVNEILSTLEATAPIASYQTYTTKANEFTSENRKYEQVIKFALNAAGEISTLYSAIEREDAPEDYEGLVVETGVLLTEVDGGRVRSTAFNVSQAVTFYAPPVYEKDSDFRVVTGTPRRAAADGIMIFDAEDGVAGAAITFNGDGTKTSTINSNSDKYVIFSHMQPTITRDENGDKVEVYEYFFYQNGRLSSRFSENSIGTMNVGDMVTFTTYTSTGYLQSVYHKEAISNVLTNIAAGTYGMFNNYGIQDWGAYETEVVLGKVKKVDNGTISITYDSTGVSSSSGYVVTNVMGDCVMFDCETGYIEPCSTSEAGEGDVVLVQANRGTYATMIIFKNSDKAGSTTIRTENELD